MTKDDLENRFDICFDTCTRASEGGYGADTTSRMELWESFHPIISEFAKQQAIAFANHIAYNDIKPHDIDTWNDGKHNTHELYDDFLQHQFIEQQNKP